ncbi:MAG TPA: tryptophan synthase subunit beta, partial [Gammaproteobacteria bacterium]|nr:tryptophan synthase subunit beta [Gammaproteobacteria bacterium]
MPDKKGHFGIYGGRFIAETLMAPIEELTQAYEQYKSDPLFIQELDADMADYVGRPSPVYFAERWSAKIGGANLYLKREDL